MKYLTLFLSLLIPCFAVKTTDAGPIHEAFVCPTAGNAILVAIPQKPPEKVKEERPYQKDDETEWIEGYWAWAAQQKGFVWVSGVFRRSPPNRRWVPGSWKQMPEGWIWIPGFWYDSNEKKISYIGTAPPNLVDPSVSKAPSDSYWMPGYWEYSEEDQNYHWLKGKWQKFDRTWVYTPAYYTWQPDGYVFVSSYWDYPLKDRGTAYASVIMEGESSYTPDVVLSDEDIIMRLFPYYPNYLCFFQYHYRHNIPWWRTFWGTPPWWKWGVWWTLTWKNQWGVWWWWSHPGYPQPTWLNAGIAEKIEPPKERLIQSMERIHPPTIVTPKGVVSPDRVLKQLKENPILPAESRRRLRVLRRSQPRDSQRLGILQPTSTDSLSEGPIPNIAPEQSISSGKAVIPPMVPPTTRPRRKASPVQPGGPQEAIPKQPRASRRPHPYWPKLQSPPQPARRSSTGTDDTNPSGESQPDEQIQPRLRQRPGRGNNS